MNHMHGKLPADNPIRTPEEDALNRTNSAKSFAEQIRALDASEGVVVGILGPWGSGKTSFINLAKRQLRDFGIEVLEFNPWMFSGANQLIDAFFIELSAQLKLIPKYAEIGQSLEEYGAMFSKLNSIPILGTWIEGISTGADILGKMLNRRKDGINGRRTEITKGLAALNNPLVIVIDDIDRLGTDEIRDVFKLVRLTGNFPNIIYLVAFDRVRVEEALAEQRIPGRDYLEKILQVCVDLPAIPQNALNKQIFSALESVLAQTESGPFNSVDWADLFIEVVRPLIRNMRDVRRYAAAVHVTVRDLEGKVALADVLTLEAIRVFAPDVFRRFHSTVQSLTSTSTGDYAQDTGPPNLKAQVEKLIEVAGEQKHVVRALISRLFPAGNRHIGGYDIGPQWKMRWLRERRVAHEELFRLYLERVMGEGLKAFTRAEQAWLIMTDKNAFDLHMRSLDSEIMLETITALEAYEADFKPEHVIPGCTVLLNLLQHLPERPGGIFELHPRAVVKRVVYRLIRSLNDHARTEAAVINILKEVHSLSARADLLTTVGYRAGIGYKLVSESAALNLEQVWRNDVRACSPSSLSEEPELLWTLLAVKKYSAPEEPTYDINSSPIVTLSILRSALNEVRSQTIGSHVVRKIPRLHWDAIVELYGNEETVAERIRDLKAANLYGNEGIVEFAEKYVSGWRPKEHDDV